jgi:hypothetical protein
MKAVFERRRLFYWKCFNHIRMNDVHSRENQFSRQKNIPAFPPAYSVQTARKIHEIVLSLYGCGVVPVNVTPEQFDIDQGFELLATFENVTL